jgi:DNA-directed RNA polymerase specialized sigma24 family protein
MANLSPDGADTESLLEKVRHGERGALDRLLAQHRAYLGRVVELLLDPRLRQRADASDVVQEAQLEAVRRLGAYLERPALPFRLWLRQLAHDRVLRLRQRHLGTARRAVGREVPLPDQSSLLLAEQFLAAEAPDILPDDWHGYHYAAGLLSTCVARVAKDANLSEEQRSALAQSYGERAVALLRQAVAKGYRSADGLRKPSWFAALQSRDDFRQLLAELQAANGKKEPNR